MSVFSPGKTERLKDWTTISVGALCDQGDGDVQTGPFGSQLHASDYVDVGIPVVMPVNLSNGRIITDGIARISPHDHQRLSKYHLKADDIIYARRGEIGRLAYVSTESDGWLCGTGCLRIRFNNPQVNNHYVSYYLGVPEVKQLVLSKAVGTTLPNLNTQILRLIPVKLPPLPTQKTIADILGSLDDKIELNRRMNETLEQMAMALYKHWFVDSVSDDGEASIGELIEFNPKCTVKRGTEIPFVDMQALPTYSLSVQDKNVIRRPFTAGSKFQLGDTLLARITPCLENGKTAYVDFLDEGVVGFGSTEFLVLRAKGDASPLYVYCLARSDPLRQQAIQSMVGTSGRQRVQATAIEQFLVSRPNPGQVKRFEELSCDWFRLIRSNVLESGHLESVRDYLLPRLLSGEIDLSEAEKQVEGYPVEEVM